MTPVSAVIVALDGLYGRFAVIATGLEGHIASISRGILRIEMPDNFDVVFTPAYPLSGSTLPVTATRDHNGNRESAQLFIYDLGAWTSEAGHPLSDEAIRKCLMPDSPPPAYDSNGTV